MLLFKVIFELHSTWVINSMSFEIGEKGKLFLSKLSYEGFHKDLLKKAKSDYTNLYAVYDLTTWFALKGSDFITFKL